MCILRIYNAGLPGPFAIASYLLSVTLATTSVLLFASVDHHMKDVTLIRRQIIFSAIKSLVKHMVHLKTN